MMGERPQRRRRLAWAGIALSMTMVAVPASVPGSAGASDGAVQVAVASTGGNGYYSKPGFLPFDPLFYGTAPRTQAEADGLPSAHALAAFLDPAGSLSRGVNGNLNIVGAPPTPVDVSYPYFAEARYPTAPKSAVGPPAPPGVPAGTTPGKATATASPDGVAAADAWGGAFSAPVGDSQHFAASGVEGHSLADAVKAVGETSATSTDVDLGGVFKARSVKVLARVERKDGHLLGTGSVQVTGATLGDVPVEINEHGLMIKGQPAGQTPDGSALLSGLAQRGITFVPPRIEVNREANSVGVKVFAPALRMTFSSEQPSHELDIIGLESGYASAAMTAPQSEAAPPPDYANLYQPPAAAAAGERPASSAAMPPAPTAAADEGSSGTATLTATPADASGYGSSTPVSYPSASGASNGAAPSIGAAPSGLGSQTASTPATGLAAAPAQAIRSVRPLGVRRSVRTLLVALWAISMLALVAAAAWQRGAAGA